MTTITCGLLKARQNLSISFFEFYQIVLILSDPLQVKVLEQQLEQEHEERISFLRERHELEGKIMGLQVTTMTFYGTFLLMLGPDFRTCLTAAGTRSRLRS